MAGASRIRGALPWEAPVEGYRWRQPPLRALLMRNYGVGRAPADDDPRRGRRLMSLQQLDTRTQDNVGLRPVPAEPNTGGGSCPMSA